MTTTEFLNYCTTSENRLRLLESLYPKFISCLADSTKLIDQEYFMLATAGEEEIKFQYRERVYCYELYHQMRTKIDDTRDKFSPFKFNGEVDKRGHIKFTDHPTLKNSVPDFLFHVPGYMEGNFIVIEVKSLNFIRRSDRKKEIIRDLTKLTAYVKDRDYLRGIYLVYGGDSNMINSLRDMCFQIGTELNTPQEQVIDLSVIDLCWHIRAGEQFEFAGWQQQ